MQDTTKQSTNREGKKILFPRVKSKEERFQEGFDTEDLLQRRKTGDALSDLLNSVDDPLVVALDGKWGTGKTWFLQRWAGHHHKNNKSSTVVYFDAFAHDYLSDPLPALVSALAECSPDDSKIIKKIKEVGFKLVKPATRIMMALASSGASEVIGAGINAMGNEIGKNIDEYWKVEKGKTTAMQEFHEALKSLAAEKKVIFVIDELDRCRPDYALEVLEIIKHFFSVPNVHFVLGVNLEALKDMVRNRYGNTTMVNDAKTYLQKFIQITLNLPSEVEQQHIMDQDVNLYLNHLCEEMKVPEHIGEQLQIQFKIVAKAKEEPISLRHVEQIVSLVNLASSEALDKVNRYEGFYGIMNDLIISRIVHPNLYQKFLNATITESELKSYLGVTDNILENNLPEGFDHKFGNQICFRYSTWTYISNNAEFKVYRSFSKDAIQQDFCGPHGGFMEKELPKIIQRDWLDRFQFYKPNSSSKTT